ncbi:MAG: ATP-binding protein [Gammaproteobacteria bacterium]|nr:ATP-binding protein [Gammaproteobacteria bacterium]
MRRQDFIEKLKKAFQVNPIVALLGPRQCGKTTLARFYFKEYFQVSENYSSHYFDLEDMEDLYRLDDPKLALGSLEGLIVIDEIQKRPDLFPMLRVLIDNHRDTQRYLILGSASRDLIQQSSETLAGRISYLELTPFNFIETHNLEKLWLRGGFPLSYLANTEEISFSWRKEYIQTFLERDIPALGIQIPSKQLHRAWSMLAHYHGQIFNASEMARSLSVSDKTIRHYLDILCGTFMIRELKPYFTNLKKRQVKSSKIYLRDSGILHALVGISDKNSLLTYPKLGASWEGLAIEEIIRHHHAREEECYFWATHSGAELDLCLESKGQLIGFECKYTSSPKISSSMLAALNELGLDKLTVIYPGGKRFFLHEKIEAVGLENYLLSG